MKRKEFITKEAKKNIKGYFMKHLDKQSRLLFLMKNAKFDYSYQIAIERCKKKTLEYIEKAKGKHNDCYGYSYDKVCIFSNDEPIIITCKKHGDFIIDNIFNFINVDSRHHNNLEDYQSRTDMIYSRCSKCKNDAIKISINKKIQEKINTTTYPFDVTPLYDTYINNNHGLKLFCNIHNESYDNRKLNKIKTCPKCIKDYEANEQERHISEAKKYCEGKGYEYVILCTGNNYSKRITFICEKHSIQTRDYLAFKKNGCPECSKEKALIESKNRFYIPSDEIIERKTNEIKQKFSEDNYNYSLFNYKTVNDDVTLICKKHNYSFTNKYKNIIVRTYPCPKCFQEYEELIQDQKITSLTQLSNEELKNYLNISLKNNENYSVVKVSGVNNIICRCEKHGTEFKYFHVGKQSHEINTTYSKPSSYHFNPQCPHCSANRIDGIYIKNKFISYELAKKFVRLHGILEYQVYKKWHKKNKFSFLPNNPHRVYLKEWNGYPEFFRDEKRFASNGEQRVYTILYELGITNIKQQKSFDGLEYLGKLFFDFYLPDLNIIIEFDGKQHFEPIDYFGGWETFWETQARDKRKNEFCEKNNIPLLRVNYKHYLDRSMEKIINDFIKNYKKSF